MAAELLKIHGLQISFPSPRGEVPAVRDVGFAMATGEAVAVVGESGCGKSLTALSILGLVPPPGRVDADEIEWMGRPLLRLKRQELRGIRGREVGMIFQEPMTSLNPVFSVGYQLGEALTTHFRMTREAVRRRCVELLQEVGIPAPESRLRAYPAQLSGGLRQRVMIAIAIACQPRLLIADEPTTALDVTIQAQIMALLAKLRAERNMGLLLITHDLGLVAQNVDRVLVMYAGYVVEEASTAALFAYPLHPYTQGLMGSIPGVGGSRRGQPLQAIAGSVPHPLNIPSGCPFRDRCPQAGEECSQGVPVLEEKHPAHRARCFKVAPCTS